MAAHTAGPPTTGMSSTVTQRATTWASENRKLLAIAAGVMVVGGGYYLYATNQAAVRKSKKPARRKSKVGPAVEPEGSRADLERGDPTASSTGSSEPGDVMSMSAEAIAALPTTRRKELAGELKSKGNKQYQARKYAAAIEFYNKAIQCDEQAVFYSNRAACHTNLNDIQAVIDDCNAALRLDSTYLKALSRRANAYEHQGTEESLFLATCDFTTACILEQFTKRETSDAVERVLAALTPKIAARIQADREPRIPSISFVQAYLNAFRPRAKPTLPESPSDGDRTLVLAFEALEAKDYAHATSLFNESIEQGFSTNELHARALNMRGTMRFLMGLVIEALEDLDFATNLEPKDPQTWVKKASVHMERGDRDAAMRDFDLALEINESDPDVFYHRGQVQFIQGNWTQAIKDYKKAVDRYYTFVFSQIQHAVALYKDEKKEKAAQIFKTYIRKHPESGELHNYYGELLLDTNEFEAANREFDKALQLEKKRPGALNVLPLVNKALCLHRWKADYAGAHGLLDEALSVDPQSDNALITRAHLLIEQSRIREAIVAYQRVIEVARNGKELEQYVMTEVATRAQLVFIENYPEEAARFGMTPDGLVETSAIKGSAS